MYFPDSYFEDEVKAGYFIDAKMKCSWAAQLEVLQEIDRICRKYNIKYFAEWGTLLATVRHGGFIPWDDDLDIGMLREDYERFFAAIEKEKPEEYVVMNYKNQDDYWDIMTRITNSKFLNTESWFLEKYHNMPYSCGVDIFPLDYIPRDKSQEEYIKDLIFEIKAVADTNGQGYIEEGELEKCLQRIETLTNQKIDRQGNIRNQLYKLVCALYAMFSEEESDQVGMMHLYLFEGHQVHPKEYYKDAIRMKYENISIPVPSGYDSILKKKYGDYMRCVRTGGSHDYPFYEKQEKFLAELGHTEARFEYDIKECIEKNPTFRQQLEEKLVLLSKIHEKVLLLHQYGDSQNELTLLNECQNLAVTIGTSIEKKLGEGTQAVANLEQYCEIIFQLYDAISQGNVIPQTDMQGMLEELIGAVITSVTQLPLKKEIVFMPYRASQWKAIESAWRKAKEDPNNDVKVVPIPYFYKRELGRKLSEMHYDGPDFPEYLNIISYEEYNLQNNHPDEIYIQNPYDGWNYTLTVHPSFFSEDLIKNCEKLIYIPWFKIDEMNPNDARGLKSRMHFVPFPGVVRADEVIVQSEAMRESYIEYLCQWLGEDTRPMWEAKIIGTGSPVNDVVEEKTKLPEEWAGKKVLLYYVSQNALLEHRDHILDKVNRTLDTFAEQAEKLQVIWLQDQFLEVNLRPRVPEVLDAYYQIIERANQNSWVTVTDTTEQELAIKMSDAFYGDGSQIAQLMKQAGKPVMLQNIEL